MRSNYVNEKQVFGFVLNQDVMGPGPRPYQIMEKNLGGLTMRDNVGETHVKSFADQAPEAYARAGRHSDFGNPADEFFYTNGKPKMGI